MALLLKLQMYYDLKKLLHLLFFTKTGLFSKTKDPILNTGAGSFVYLFC